MDRLQSPLRVVVGRGPTERAGIHGTTLWEAEPAD
jgi:hypothetical protein